jgi:hypothetical protein
MKFFKSSQVYEYLSSHCKSFYLIFCVKTSETMMSFNCFNFPHTKWVNHGNSLIMFDSFFYAARRPRKESPPDVSYFFLFSGPYVPGSFRLASFFFEKFRLHFDTNKTRTYDSEVFF